MVNYASRRSAAAAYASPHYTPLLSVAPSNLVCYLELLCMTPHLIADVAAEIFGSSATTVVAQLNVNPFMYGGTAWQVIEDA